MLCFQYQGVRNVACISLAIGYPTAASAPHSIVNGFKRLLAVAAETDYTFKEAERVSTINISEQVQSKLIWPVPVIIQVELSRKYRNYFKVYNSTKNVFKLIGHVLGGGWCWREWLTKC